VSSGWDLVRGRRAHFGDDVEAYDFGRPGYPDRVYELLQQHCGLGRGTRVLEIGPGTGQATGRLLGAGAAVHAVELNEALAARLRAKFAGADLAITVAPFESATLPDAGFDLAVAATCFHWLPADVGIARCAAAVRPGGAIALWWNFFGDPDRPDPFHEALTEVLRAKAPELLDGPRGFGDGVRPPHALDIEARVEEMCGSGHFVEPVHEVIAWTGRHTPAQLRALFASYSPWIALAQGRREPLLDDLERLAHNAFGAVVERPYLTPIYLACRAAD